MNLLTDVWKELGPDDLQPGQHRGVKLGPQEFVLVSNVAGSYFAIDDWCNHAGCLLSRSKLEGDIILCHCHYAEFNAKTGVLISKPRICEDQTQYEIKKEDGKLWGKRLPDPPPSDDL